MRATHGGSRDDGATRRSRTSAAVPLSGSVLTIVLAVVTVASVILGSGPSLARGSADRGNASHGVYRTNGSATAATHPKIDATAARFLVSHAAITAQSGQTVAVRGRLLTAPRDLKVKLLAREGRRWLVVGHGHTLRGGRFHIRYTVRSVGATHLRVSVSVPGGVHASAPAGQVVGLAPALASWYYDAGNTACGFHATYGVANRTLPCGTQVTIVYGGRSVVATVDDRGPYVYGRTFDLNQNTSRALGMYGVAEVLTSV